MTVLPREPRKGAEVVGRSETEKLCGCSTGAVVRLAGSKVFKEKLVEKPVARLRSGRSESV